MEIIIKPKSFTGTDYWESKLESVILVKSSEDIEPLWKLLVEQDDYWLPYKHIIKVAPTEINDTSDLISLCEYAGKTDIDNVDELKAKIPFIIFQVNDEGWN